MNQAIITFEKSPRGWQVRINIFQEKYPWWIAFTLKKGREFRTPEKALAYAENHLKHRRDFREENYGVSIDKSGLKTAEG